MKLCALKSGVLLDAFEVQFDLTLPSFLKLFYCTFLSAA
jgi:hypothetical protein